MSMTAWMILVSCVGAGLFFLAGYLAGRGRAPAESPVSRSSLLQEPLMGDDDLRAKVAELAALLDGERTKASQLEAKLNRERAPKFPVHNKFAD